MDHMNIMLLMPEIFLVLTGLGFLLVGVFQGNRTTDVLCWSACLSFVIAALMILRTDWGSQSIMDGMLIFDAYGAVFQLIIIIGMLFSLVLCVEYIYQERIARFEYPVLMVFAGIGMLLMVSATNFLSLYMALELQSLSLYVLAAFHRNSLKSGEAAAKYFILGALSSGMLLFGISLIYGFSGSLDFQVIHDSLHGEDLIPPGFTVGMVFVIAALVFKISAAPFHMWTPDVYQGAPTSVTAFFALVPKVAALGLLIRLLFVPFEAASVQWEQILYFVCLCSLVVGSFAAIVQSNIKRLFAYSSIGNMGYILIGLIAGGTQGIAAAIIFLVIYVIMTAGIFAVILCMRRDGMALERINDLAGLSHTRPILAYIMAILMFSMSGIPPLAGFFGKFFIFEAAIKSELYVLATFGIVASVVAAYYYLRIIKVMFFDEAADVIDQKINLEKRIILLLCMIFVIGFIFKPTFLIESAMLAAESLFL